MVASVSYINPAVRLVAPTAPLGASGASTSTCSPSPITRTLNYFEMDNNGACAGIFSPSVQAQNSRNRGSDVFPIMRPGLYTYLGIFGGSFLINPENILAEGGCGTVLKIQNQPELLLKRAYEDEASREAVRHEGNVLRVLGFHHIPHVPRLIDSSSPEMPEAFIVISNEPGVHLDRLTISQGKEFLLKDIFLKVAQIVQHLHSKGITHGDIKPENILVDLEGDEIKNVFLIDYGLGRIYHEAMTTYVVSACSGTPGYMPWEMIKVLGESSDHSGRQITLNFEDSKNIDLYALGATFYRLIRRQSTLPHGQLPYSLPFPVDSSGESHATNRFLSQIYMRMNREDYCPLSQIDTRWTNSLTQDVLLAIDAMCSKEPSQRTPLDKLIQVFQK